MGILDSIKGQLRSVIEWENPSPAHLFQMWTENGDELKNASKLIVKPGQGVILLYEGKVQAVHDTEGLYEISSANIPFLTTLFKIMQSFESEHKVGVYFYWKSQFLNQKWGTLTPIKYNDPVYKFPVALKGFGNFSFQLTDASSFFSNIVGSRPVYLVEEARKVINDRIIEPLTDTFATAGYSFGDIDKHRSSLSSSVQARVTAEFAKLGFLMSDFRIEGTTFDEDTMRRIGRIADMNAEGQAAAAAGVNYAQMQQLEAMREAARNEGGGAGAGMGLGAGFGFGSLMAGQIAGMQQPGGAVAAATAATPDAPARLKSLKDLLDGGLITQDEFDKKKAEILASI